MRVSIVIPNYNSGAVLERAIQSLLAQQYPDLQIVVADSESRDASREILERYRSHFDPLIVKKDRGQPDGLNNGFAETNGEIFGWLCADDELLPGALQHVAELFRAHPEVDVISGGCERVFADGSRCQTAPAPDAWEILGMKNTLEQPSTFWRAALHRRIGAVDASFYLAFDWDFWCRMRRAGARFLATGRPLSRYYFSETNKSGTSGEAHVKESFRVVRRYGPYRGALAYIFRFLYYRFDLHGCYDNPPTCTLPRAAAFGAVLRLLRALIGERRLYLYNWHFASCQQRNLKWW